MYKCIALLKRKAGISREELMDYYEKRHVPLIRSLLPQIRDYRRNFIDFSDESVGQAPDFDVITELWFDDRAAYESFRASSADPEIFRRIGEDEENIFDRTATRLFVVDERGIPAATPPLSEMAKELKLLRDEREIKRVLALYTTLLDAKNFRPLDQVFVDDVLFNYGRGGDQKGLAALRDFIQSSLDVCGGTQHLLGQTVIDVNGDRASSRTYVHAQHQGVDDLGGPIFDTAGAYVDEWERRPEGWRITSRRALWSTVHGEPAIVNVERVYLE